MAEKTELHCLSCKSAYQLSATEKVAYFALQKRRDVLMKILQNKKIAFILVSVFILAAIAVGVMYVYNRKPDVAHEEILHITQLLNLEEGYVLPDEMQQIAHFETIQAKEDEEYLKELGENIERFIEGTFNWDYTNENNKQDFLAFRAGNCLYEGKFIPADEIYNNIHAKIKAEKLKIRAEFIHDFSQTYIKPVEGGYTFAGDLKLSVTSDQEGYQDKEFTIRYEAIFTFITPREADTWEFWSPKEYGVLFISRQYFEIEK